MVVGMDERTRQSGSAARQAWNQLGKQAENPIHSPLWQALMRAPRNGVLDRATTLLETRAQEMEERCEQLLGGWPRPSDAVVERSDAVAMQTIVSSYADALDQVNGVLDTIITSLDQQIERHDGAMHVARRSVDSWLTTAEQQLAAPSENIDDLDHDAISATRDTVASLETAYRQYHAAQRALHEAGETAGRCRHARIQVLISWRLALLVEGNLADIAR